MDVKKAATTVLSIGGMIGLGVICKNKISPKTVKETVEKVKEPMFGNVPLSKLKEVAKLVHPFNELRVDADGNLKLLYKSGRGHQTNVQKFGFDKINNKIVALNGGTLYAPGQRGSYAETFLKKANELFNFE